MPRLIDLSLSDCRYAKKQADYLSAGVDFWWNDEGETMCVV